MRLLDAFLHRTLDWYIDRGLPGWGFLQLMEWKVCDAYENRIHNARIKRDATLDHNS